MADSPIKVFKELYLTYKQERFVKLGFMSPYGKDKAFLKRQETQLDWAYQPYFRMSQHEYAYHNWWYELNGKNILIFDNKTNKFYEWTLDENLELIDIPEHCKDFLKDFFPNGVPDKFPKKSLKEVDDHPLMPEIIPNIPTIGFQIAKEVRRSGWNGGNVVWRVTDPRGFDLEISSANLARIIDCSVIEKGIIMDTCIWGRDKSRNILVPYSSDLYKRIVNI